MSRLVSIIQALGPLGRRLRRLLTPVAVLVALVALAGGAQAGVGDYPSPLYLAGPASSVTGHGSSYRLVGSLEPAPTATVVTAASSVSAATYRYVYSVDRGSGESWSAGTTATVATANAEAVTVSGLPTGAGVTVLLYRINVTSPTNCYSLLWSSGANNALDSYTDTSGTLACGGALRRSEDRYPLSSTGWTELSPATTAPFLNSPVVASPAAPNAKGWIVDAPGQVSFPAGTWTFQVQTRSTNANGAALLVVGMWKVDAATGAPVGAAVLAPTEQVQAPASLVTPASALQTVTIDAAVPAWSLEANERLYVQFWRHQTAAYTSGGATNRILTLFAWDGFAKITHPAASGFATEPTLVTPVAGASTGSRQLTATFTDPDASDSGTVEFRVCTAGAAAGVPCAGLVDTGSSPGVAKGAQAAWSIGAALTDAATYHWQARGRDALGGTSAWTATRSFRVEPPPQTPSHVAPADGAVLTSLDLQATYHDPEGGAGALEFRVCPAPAAAGVECAAPAATGTAGGLASDTNGSWAPTSLARGTYHWQSRAVDSVGASSAWSATRAVRLQGAPAAPALLVPADDAAVMSLALEVSYSDPDGDSGGVELRVCSAAAGAGEACRGEVATGWFATVASGATVRWTTAPSLRDGVYHWQSRASDAFRAVSPWSATRSVRIDTRPPSAPAHPGATIAGDGLVLRWEAPPGGDAIESYIVYVDGKPVQTLDAETHEARLGPFDASDRRRFSVAAVDVAGNHGPQTAALVGVPVLVGLTADAARAALAARGLALREQGRGGRTAGASVVLGQSPEAPALVATGSAVAVVLSAGADSGPLLRFTTVRATCSNRPRLTLGITLRDPARITVTVQRSRRTLATWRLGLLGEGGRRPALRLPASLRRPGHYRVVVAASADGRTERRSRPVAVACSRA